MNIQRKEFSWQLNILGKNLAESVKYFRVLNIIDNE